MGFIYTHDTPLAQAALAAGVGTLQGQQIVDRIIYEREQQIAEEARKRADRQRYGDERVVGGRGYDQPYIRQPRNVNVNVRGNGYGGTGQPQSISEYQQGQLNLGQQRVDLQRDKASRPKEVPDITPQQQIQNDFERQRVELDQQKFDHTKMKEGRDAVLKFGKSIADSPLMGWLTGRPTKYDYAKQKDSNENRRIEIAQGGLQLRRDQFEAGKSKVPPRIAAAIAVGVMDPKAVAQQLMPLYEAMNPAGRYDGPDGKPIPEAWTNDKIILAQNLVKAIENMPAEVKPDGSPAYSITQLIQRRAELEAGGVPRPVLLMLDRAIEARSQKEMSNGAPPAAPAAPIGGTVPDDVEFSDAEAASIQQLVGQGQDIEAAMAAVLAQRGQ